MDPNRTLSYCHSLLDECGEVESEVLHGEKLHLVSHWDRADNALVRERIQLQE